jgi:hypothetical protein
MEKVHGNTLFLKKKITVNFIGFKDKESGIDHFEIGIGTQPFFTDILSSSVYHEDNIVINMQYLDIKDGLPYYVAAKVSI